jgi:alkaline phosphatase
MKWRNQLLALFCLLGFAALGVVYFQLWVVQKPFGIVLFIGEGLTPEGWPLRAFIPAALMRGSRLIQWENVALLTNFSNDFATPDQAAAATAFATGKKSNNHTIGLDVKGRGDNEHH